MGPEELICKFDENDPDQVLNCEEFKSLFANQHLALMIAHDLYTHGKAVLEIRRSADGRIIGLDAIDVTTIAPTGDFQYEQRIGDRSIWIDADKVLVIRLDRRIA